MHGYDTALAEASVSVDQGEPGVPEIEPSALTKPKMSVPGFTESVDNDTLVPVPLENVELIVPALAISQIVRMRETGIHGSQA